jgi:hypothetical protein
VSAVGVVLAVLGVLASAFVVYAIYRYGVIPAVRNLMRDGTFTALWREGGWWYRLSLFLMLLAIALALASGAMIMAGLVWQSGVAFVVAIVIVTLANMYRFRVLQRYRGW